MQVYTIPLSPLPQAFNIALAGHEYRLTVRWAAVNEGGWYLDISKPDNAGPIVCGIPLITGCDLLEPYHYLNFGGELWVDSEDVPSLENLGAGVELVFVIR